MFVVYFVLSASRLGSRPVQLVFATTVPIEMTVFSGPGRRNRGRAAALPAICLRTLLRFQQPCDPAACAPQRQYGCWLNQALLGSQQRVRRPVRNSAVREATVRGRRKPEIIM
jgi:hypothetical protein